MKVIIPGGSGQVGTLLARALSKDGHEVVVLSRMPERVSGLPAGARAVRWDVRTADGWQGEADGADAIVNRAGEGTATARWTAGIPLDSHRPSRRCFSSIV